jgi:hypothetical protein
MEEENAVARSPNAQVIGTKSWLAYAGTILLAVLLFGGLLPLAFLWNEIAAGIVFVVSAIYIGYRLLLLRSLQLYFDEVGVWVYQGILPWNRGVTGVKWRDMEDASFVQTFWSWLTRSYTIRIGHRFTKTSEIVLTHIGSGHKVVAALNSRHQQLIRDGVVT